MHLNSRHLIHPESSVLLSVPVPKNCPLFASFSLDIYEIPDTWQGLIISHNHTCISSVQFSHSVMSDSATPWTAACQASLSITTPRVYSNSCLLSQWCHPTISSSVIPFSSRLQSFPASGSFPVGQLFASGGQSIVDYNAVLISAVCKSDSVIYIHTCICIYIYFFFRFFSIVVNYRILNIVPCTTQQGTIIVYNIVVYNIVYLLIPNSKLIPNPFPL